MIEASEICLDMILWKEQLNCQSSLLWLRAYNTDINH